MPSSVEQPARREALAREAARRQAVTTLEVAGAIASYAARQIGNGLSPEAARLAAIEAAAELEAASVTLRRLTGPAEYRAVSPAACRALSAAGRGALAVEPTAAGMTQREAAARLGVSPRRVWDYLSGR